MSNLLLGDEVYWNDPDEGTCSGYGTFVRHLNDEVAIIRKDDVEMEVFVKELSQMSECQMCHAEDSSVLEFCQDCYDEMKGESDEAGQEFSKYWEVEDE